MLATTILATYTEYYIILYYILYTLPHTLLNAYGIMHMHMPCKGFIQSWILSTQLV